MLFTVEIDGKLIHSVENKTPKTFRSVQVSVGDNFNPAADAKYRNLVWKSLPDNRRN